MNVNDFIDDFLEKLAEELASTLPDLKEKLIAASRDAILGNVSRVETWMVMLAGGQLTEEELSWLVRAKMDLSNLVILENSGLTLTRIDTLRQTIARTFISTIMAAAGV